MASSDKRDTQKHLKDSEKANVTPSYFRTREELEGATAQPVNVPEKDLEVLTPGSAQPMKPSAERRRPQRDRFAEAFQSDLEPESPAARRAKHAAAAPDPAEKDATSQPTKPPRRKLPLAAKVLIALVVVLGTAVGAGALWIASLESAMSVSDETQRAELEATLVSPAPSDASGEEGPFYVLIIGSDARLEDNVSRSDVIMLARVDVSASTVTLVSIPRDTMINGIYGVGKINAEYNNGPAATVKAVSEYAGVDISHYVEVEFEGLEQVVDSLGGVTVNIPEDIPAGNGGMTFSAGEQLLNGEQALAYARERYNVTGGDFGRAQAQRQIVEAIVRQVMESSPSSMPGLVSQLAQSITTDLKISDIVLYAIRMQQSEGGLIIYSAAAPSYTLYQGGVWYVATMYDEWRAMMQRVDAGLDPLDLTAQVPEAQANNERLGSAVNAAGPRDYQGLAASAGLTTEDVASTD